MGCGIAGLPRDFFKTDGIVAPYITSRPGTELEVFAAIRDVLTESPSKSSRFCERSPCFVAPPAATFGDLGRSLTTVRQPGIANHDFSLFKNTKLTERVGLQFRTEFFNIFNRVQFGPPGETLGTAQFGVINSQLNTPRLIQFALRLNY